jgi:hypothetical protein
VGPSDDFYFSPAMTAPSVLDLGCGTGTLLKGARTAGHTGRLVELAIMTGHAFQCLATDHELRASLAAVRRALVPGWPVGGRDVQPAARAWETWASARLRTSSTLRDGR